MSSTATSLPSDSGAGECACFPPFHKAEQSAPASPLPPSLSLRLCSQTVMRPCFPPHRLHWLCPVALVFTGPAPGFWVRWIQMSEDLRPGTGQLQQGSSHRRRAGLTMMRAASLKPSAILEATFSATWFGLWRRTYELYNTPAELNSPCSRRGREPTDRPHERTQR